MPRKQSKEGKPMNATGEELKAVRLELPIETHRQLRMQAAREEKSMAALCKEVVEEYLKRKKGAK
jgi:plasmid stability protein